MQNGNPEFDRIIGTEFTDPNPYGIPAQTTGKPGLTVRGKAALAVGATVIAGGSLMGYQAYSAQAAVNEAKVQEIALKKQALELKELKELNRSRVQQATARQKSIDACVDDQKGLIGKQLGVTYRSVVEDCQAQYLDAGAGGMETVGSASQADTNTGDGASAGLLLGGGALVLFFAVAARRGRASGNPA